MPQPETLLDLDHVTLRWPNGLEALGPIDAVLEAGRPTGIVGPSGCGKSTRAWRGGAALPP